MDVVLAETPGIDWPAVIVPYLSQRRGRVTQLSPSPNARAPPTEQIAAVYVTLARVIIVPGTLRPKLFFLPVLAIGSFVNLAYHTCLNQEPSPPHLNSTVWAPEETADKLPGCITATPIGLYKSQTQYVH